MRVLPATVPAAVVGLLAQGLVEKRLGGIRSTALLMAASGAALLVADRRPSWRPPAPRDVQVAGAAQVAALAPGVSRSGATLTALRAREVSREDALRTSLVMSLPVTLGAAALTAVRSRRAPRLVPTVIAGAASYVTTRRVTGSPRLYSGSSGYRLGLAAAVLARSVRRSA